MTNDYKPPMFGPSAVFDPKDNSHTVVFAPARSGMSADYSALGLTDAEVSKIKVVDTDHREWRLK